MNRTLARTAIVLTMIFCGGVILLLMAGVIRLPIETFLEGITIEIVGVFLTAGVVYFIAAGISQAADEPTLTDLTREVAALKVAVDQSTASLMREIGDLNPADDDSTIANLKREMADLKAIVNDLQAEVASLKENPPDDEGNDD